MILIKYKNNNIKQDISRYILQLKSFFYFLEKNRNIIIFNLLENKKIYQKEILTTKIKMAEIKVNFGDVNDKNYELLRTLNTVTFPVQYTLSFYAKVLTYSKYSRLAYFNDILVGAMTCRQEEKDGQQSVYILTIGVLDAYRKHKIGTQLMDELLKLVKQDPVIKCIYLHMQVGNEAGLKFYEKHGFRIAQTLENYYTDISPKACYILQKDL